MKGFRPLVEVFASGLPALVYDARELVGNEYSCAQVSHVLNSGGGELYKTCEDFEISFKKIFENYEDYSKRASIYSQQFRQDSVAKLNVDLFEKLYNKSKNVN